MDHLARVQGEIDKYEHLLARFSVRQNQSGGLDLVIELKDPPQGAHVYTAPLHERDIEHPQFTWTFQKYLYDCLHDYLVEMFTRNPQLLEDR